tara:strand:- start:602 stop:1369 length:768 start_codon:yes stop_codon:yes gene_type:complete
MTDNNLKLWDSFGVTDVKYTKAANVDGNRQTSLAGNYMVKLATKSLGPIGQGWGYEVIEERFDNTKPLMIKIPGKKESEILLDNGQIVWELSHTLHIRFWHGSRENNFTQYGHTKYRYVTSSGKVYVDTEYAKKSLTDAMKKCLSLIGVCNDVFMGMFDDANYIAEAQAITAANTADEGTAVQKEIDAIMQEVGGYNAAAEKLNDIEAVKKVYLGVLNTLKTKGPHLGMDVKGIQQKLNAKFKESQERIENDKPL